MDGGSGMLRAFGGLALSNDLKRRGAVPRAMRGLAGTAILSACLLLTACSITAPFSPAAKLPREPAESPPATAPAQSGDRPVAVPMDGPPPTPPDATARRHRQYYDQKRRRFYFYDPVLKKYFWEDGTPK